jgi:phenylacetate-CoA ligase
MDLEKLYVRLPVAAQNLLCTWEGWRQSRFRYGGQDPVAEVAERSSWSTARIEEFQNARIQLLLAHVYENVPYYRKLLKKLGAQPSDFRTADDLKQLPVLTKTTIRENVKDFRAADIREPVVKVHTSGTTGAGLDFFVNQSAIREQWAVWWRYRSWHGITRQTWSGYFGGRTIVAPDQQRPPFWRMNRFGKQVLYSGYHLKPANLEAYVNDLVRRGLTWIHGYPSLLCLIANATSDRGLQPGLNIRIATTGAENLLPWQKEGIEAGFGCPVRQHYGSAEGVANLSECEAGRLHVDEDFCALELQSIPGTAQYHLLGTSLTNFAMPLIRYETGDVCSAPQTCDCGRWGCVVERLDGRAEDYLVLSDGTMVGRVDHIFKDMTSVQEAQIWQQRPGELEVRIVPAPQWSESDETRLRREFEKRFGNKAQVQFRYLTELPRTRTGKLRLVVSEIKGSRIRSVMEER